MTTPRYTVPPEWVPQSTLWVGWPHLEHEWGTAFTGARREIAAFIAAASHHIPVNVSCGSAEAETSAGTNLKNIDGVSLHRIPAGDIWLRDTGPIIAFGPNGQIALKFEFNGWGNKYVMLGDRETAEAIAAVEQIPVQLHDFVLEGGAIELDGAGRLLTTRQCMLNPNRNSDWTEPDAEQTLRSAFNVEDIIWLDRGLTNDHTDGHIDNIARFIGPSHVLCQRASGADDPNAEAYEKTASDLAASGLQVSTIASPGRIEDAEGNVLPASHMNFTITNGAVILPVYEDVYSRAAADALRSLLVDRKIVPLPSASILTGGGSFHCMTREIPKTQHQDTL